MEVVRSSQGSSDGVVADLESASDERQLGQESGDRWESWDVAAATESRRRLSTSLWSVWRCIYCGPDSFKRTFAELQDILGNGIYERRLGGHWTCVVRVVWKWRNAVIFATDTWNFNRILE